MPGRRRRGFLYGPNGQAPRSTLTWEGGGEGDSVFVAGLHKKQRKDKTELGHEECEGSLFQRQTEQTYGRIDS